MNLQYQYQNQLDMARRADAEREKSPVENLVDQAKEQAKQYAKKEIKKWIVIHVIVPFAFYVLPWILLIGLILLILYAGCTNMLGTWKGWFISQAMSVAGICSIF